MVKLKNVVDLGPVKHAAELAQGDPVEVVYGKEDKLYRVRYENGHIRVTHRPGTKVIEYIRVGDLKVKKRVYIGR